MADSDRSPALLTWGMTAAVVVAGALALYAVRDALLPRLAFIPDLGNLNPPEPPPVVETPVEPEPEPEPEEPAGPQWTYEQIEAMLAPLPARVLELVAEGREDLESNEFKDLGSEDANLASRSRRFFQNWGRTWLNRLGQLEKDTPPWEECRLHAALEPACALLFEVYDLLREVPLVTSIEDGTTILASGEQMVEDFLNPPEAEEEGEDGDGEGEDEDGDGEGGEDAAVEAEEGESEGGEDEPEGG